MAMKIIERVLAKELVRAAKTFPAITLTGPRQSGKTTLVKMLFQKSHNYVNLEDPDVRLRAREDALSFFKQYEAPLIIDEIQYVPELLSYIKTKIDTNRKPGQWILTGSQNFVLMDRITQTLAGRSAVLYLLPLSISERVNNAHKAQNMKNRLKSLTARRKGVSPASKQPRLSITECLLRGFYPEIALHNKVDRRLWCGSYITTYIERDIRNLASIGDLSQFERFIVACAIRTGQIINISEIARDIGISVPTAKRWLSLLETGHQIYLLYPYYRNIGKRLVKSPKLYFVDPAICTFLLGIDNVKTLVKSVNFGALFETMVVGDFLKRFLHTGSRVSMYYLRSRDGLEIDMIIELDDGKLHLFEIKSAMTITKKHANSLLRIAGDNQLARKIVTKALISRTDDSFNLTDDIANYSWKDVLIS